MKNTKNYTGLPYVLREIMAACTNQLWIEGFPNILKFKRDKDKRVKQIDYFIGYPTSIPTVSYDFSTSEVSVRKSIDETWRRTIVDQLNKSGYELSEAEGIKEVFSKKTGTIRRNILHS